MASRGGGGVLPTDDAAQVDVGALEQSNVSPSQVMVEMVQAQRLFDIRTKLLSTAKDVDQSGTSLLRQSAGS
jgi:flagellar basal-body rod protein FlgF